jgi:hypothetical protein
MCFPRELGPFLEGNSLFLGEVGFSLRNNHVFKENEFKLPWGAI